MKHKRLILVVLLLMFGLSSFAQQVSITGTVKDKDGEPLLAATVAVDGTNQGTITDIDGNFTIKVAMNGTISVSNIGYQTQSITVSNLKHLNITLQEDAIEIESMVVVGYGTQKREDLVSSVSDMSGADIRQTGLNNLTHAIQDALPGVIATVSSGQPGQDDASLAIRGLSTFGSSNEPLILVDGVEVSGGFSAINPGEISSISALKDASATSIYGSKGANGVILITTRRGEDGAPRISVTSSVTAKSAIDTPDQVGSYDALMIAQTAAKNSGVSGFANVRASDYVNAFTDPFRDQILYPNIDWYDEMIKPVAFDKNASITVSGGTDKVKYFSSLSYDNTGDIMNITNVSDTYDPRFSFEKYNFRANLDFKVSKSTDLRVDIAGRTSTTKTPNIATGEMIAMLNSSTAYTIPLYYTAEFLKEHPDPLDPDAYLNGDRIADASSYTMPGHPNPYMKVNYYGFTQNTSQVVDMKVGLDQKLDFIAKGLTAYGTFNYSTVFNYKKAFQYLTQSDSGINAHLTEPLYYYDYKTESWYGTAYDEIMTPYHPKDSEYFQSTSRNLFYEFKLAYNNSFGKHNIDAVGVMNRTIYYGNITNFPAYLENWVGRASYNYDGRYFFEVSAAYNGTDKFARGKKFGFFPAMALGYNIANENFIKDNVDFIDQLKLRVSYGVSGSEGSAGNYMYEGGYVQQHTTYSNFVPGINWRQPPGAWVETKVANENATWEEAYKANAGIDAAFFNKSLTMSIDLYSEKRSGIMVVPPSSTIYNPGISNIIDVTLAKMNLGEMDSHGLEYVVNYTGKINKDLRYNIGGNFSLAENRVVYAADYANEFDYLKKAGKPSGWISGYQTSGYVTSFEQQINSVNSSSYKQGGTQPGTYAYVDFNSDGYIDTKDMIPMEGTSQPMCVYGFNFGVDYKRWSFSARFYGKSGITYGSSSTYMYPYAKQNSVVVRDQHLGNLWDFDNQDSLYPTVMSYIDNTAYATNNLNLIDGSYFKLKSISVRYQLSSPYLQEKLRIQNASIYVTGDNLYSWSNLPYGDPEGGNAISSNYPLTRKFILGIDLNF